jgi:glutamate formiminotransferase
MNMKKEIMETVPNFSEGRDLKKVEYITDAFRARHGVKLLDYSSDADHNRMVVTAIGEPEALTAAVVEAAGRAVEVIDLTNHHGEHPRIGAIDVIPFIPLRGMDMLDASFWALSAASSIASGFCLPVFLYEESATSEHRRNLADIRRGGFEGLKAKMQTPEWKPDFGPASPHPTAGAAVIGARRPLIAFNVNLDTDDISIANKIARKLRGSNGGLRFCKALGMQLTSSSKVQVSMNLTDYTQTSLYQVVEMVRMEAARYGVRVSGSELIGLVPAQAIADAAAYYLGLDELSMNRILELNFEQ